MKYDSQLGDLTTKITNAKNCLVLLPSQANVDELAAGLSLMLALKNAGKNASIVSEANPLVAQSNLFGVGELKNQLPTDGAGDFTISLEGVVTSDGKVPSLEKLDWFPQGSNLNLVFHVLPGQKFEPIDIKHFYQGNNFDLIFVIGAQNPMELGSLYLQNADKLTNLINIDNGQANSSFGKINIVDPAASSVCEIMTQLLPALSLSLDQDIATNLVNGIYEQTANLSQRVTPDTFLAISQVLQAGAKIPQSASQPIQASTPVVQIPQATPAEAVPTQPAPNPAQPVISSLVNSPFLQPQPTTPTTNLPFLQSPTNPDPSAEERPMGEFAGSSSPETVNPSPDWLAPKIFKGNA